MKRFAVAAALSFFLPFNLSIHAQDAKSQADDSYAVRATVRNYIEAYYTGDAHRFAQTLHPHYLKHMIHGDIPMRERTAAEMVKEITKNGAADMPAASKTEQVVVLDVSKTIASAKLITPGWTDYVALEKVDSEWKILSVVQRIDD